MKFTKEMIEKAKAAKSAEELAEMAKAEGVELTAEKAEKYFAELNKKGELADEELDNVAGGCGGTSPSKGNTFLSEAEVTYKHSIGDRVEVKIGAVGTVACKILARGTDSGVFSRSRYTKYYPTYQVEAIGDPFTSANWFGGTQWVNEVDIEE